MVNSYIRVAGAVTLEARRVVRHQLAVVLELDPDRVVSRAVTRAVHAEAADEDPPVHAELDAVTPAPIPDWSIVIMKASDWSMVTYRHWLDL